MRFPVVDNVIATQTPDVVNVFKEHLINFDTITKLKIKPYHYDIFKGVLWGSFIKMENEDEK